MNLVNKYDDEMFESTTVKINPLDFEKDMEEERSIL